MRARQRRRQLQRRQQRRQRSAARSWRGACSSRTLRWRSAHGWLRTPGPPLRACPRSVTPALMPQSWLISAACPEAWKLHTHACMALNAIHSLITCAVLLRGNVIKMGMRAYRCARVTTYVTWMAWHAQEGIQAVREKASFLEHELREQLTDARRFLEDERAARRAAEASLATQLEQARADAGALRVRLIAAKDSDNHREVCTCIL